MRKGQTVSYESLNRALRHVQRVFDDLGIYDKLACVDVYWCELPQLTVPTAHGFFTHGDQGFFGRLLGYDEGHIFIPKVVPLQLWMQNRGSLRGILFHEYSHAIAYYYPSLVRGKKFREAFGGPYGWQERCDDQPEDAFVSKYAMTCPSENFAETFQHFITCRKVPTSRRYHPGLKRKLEFIGNMLKRLKG